MDNTLKPSRALVTDPSGAVLFGMNVQHKSPNMWHTPPFSASSMSRANLFGTAMSDWGPIVQTVLVLHLWKG